MNKCILHTIIIYTLAHCPSCIKAKALLDKKNVVYQEIAVENFTDQQREELAQKTGRRTVPQIFIDDKSIGGCDELYTLERAGKLDALLKDPLTKGPATAG